ncbi:hypothetical protein AYW79_06975 [Ferroacidibacillus organovorans]|uniref:Addiction module toxin RelE n=1 Tax=Ferroacidibacillus organovorans TaxID=1765683 RepID=A0A853KCR8_9BACL|nr:hypothetical protein AYJ22_06345 [Ferroacidibacillus organovorans]OAG94158.1 hypothetical protein AYW79_06975 [Ferroacidibacillus organovorans]
MTRRITFSQSALKQISRIQSERFSVAETADFQVRLIQEIENRLINVGSEEGLREHYHGSWANTRRVIVFGYRVYYVWEADERVTVRGLKAPGMK